MKYIKIHKSKFIKFFIVIFVCVFGFFGVNIMVNADSIWNFGDVNQENGDYPGNYMNESHFNWDTFYTSNSVVGIEALAGGNDTLVWFNQDFKNIPVYDYWKFKCWIGTNYIDYEMPRLIALNQQKSNDDLLYYDCTIENLGYADYFIFEKNDFFMRLNDLRSDRLPIIKFPQTNVAVGMEIHGFILDKDGNTRELSLVIPDKRVTHNSAFYLYPSKSELFGNIDFDEVYSSNAIMYISNYRCMIEFPEDTLDIPCNYYYSVQSVNDAELRYGTILTDYVNTVSSSDIVGGVADNVNSFLQIEILPGLSFFGILLLAIAVPMLIWILKIFFGG